MVHFAVYTLLAVFIVSLISFIGVISLSFQRETLNKILLTLVSLSAGTLFGGAFLHLLPEAVAVSGFTLQISLLVLAGVLTFFILEKIVHSHLYKCEHGHEHAHGLTHEPHKHHIGIMNLVGDGAHNFVDGLIIAGAFLVNINLGIITTLAVILHEVPQELADFGVLVYSGFSRIKALMFNFLSSAIAIVGAIVGLSLGAKGEMFVQLILPFAAGGFIYIAGANLIPELHKKCGIKDDVYHILAMLVGIGIMVGLLFLEF